MLPANDDRMDGLRRMVADLGDSERTVSTVLEYLSVREPEIHFFCGIYREHPALSFRVAMVAQDGHVGSLLSINSVYCRTSVAFDRWQVEAEQRNNWTSINLHALRSAPVIHFWEQRRQAIRERLLLTRGGIPVAYLSANCEPEKNLSPQRHAKLRQRCGEVTAILRMTANAADADNERQSLSETLLPDAEGGALLASDNGVLLATSPNIRRVIDQDPELEAIVDEWVRSDLLPARHGRWRFVVLTVASVTSGVRALRIIARQKHDLANLVDDFKLTPRQRELCDWLVHGLSNRELAAVMHIKASTVKTMLERLYGQFGVGGRVELLLALGRVA